jgi:hypothetical protein
MTITRHAYKRGWERLRFRKPLLKKMAYKALTEGVKRDATKGLLRKYLDKSFQGNIRIYGEIIYLFEKDKLITVLHVPSELKRYL